MNCIRRHIRPFSFSISREGNHPEDFSRLTYKKLLEEVCRFSNVLKSHGVRKGDRVSIYMPMVLELPIAILACCRIGAVHSIVVCTARPNKYQSKHKTSIQLKKNSLSVCRLFFRFSCRTYARLPGENFVDR